jgi:hypothetical protein
MMLSEIDAPDKGKRILMFPEWMVSAPEEN